MKSLHELRRKLIDSENLLRDHAYECSPIRISKKMVNDAVDALYKDLVESGGDTSLIVDISLEIFGELNRDYRAHLEMCQDFLNAFLNDFKILNKAEKEAMK